MRRDRRVALAALLLLAASAAMSLWRVRPAVGDGDAPVSLANLRRHVAVVAAEPHPVGSEANRRVRDYLLGELRALGLSPAVQPGSVRNFRGAEVAVENIVCLVPGTSGGAGDRILLACHYDAAPRAPGAGDDAAGVAATLEVARLLRESPAARDVILLITDGEEAGLVGAQLFAQQHPDAMGANLVLNLEARGTKGPSVMFETSGLSRDVLDAYAETSPHPVTSSLADEVYRLMPNNTDFTVFARMGLAGLNFAFIDGYANYHTPRDDPARLADASLRHQAAQAWAVTSALANGARVDRPAERLVFFDVLGLYVVRYGLGVAWALTAVAGALAALAVARLRPRAGRLAMWLGLFLAHLVAVAAWVHLVSWAWPAPKAAHRWTPLGFAAAALLAIAGASLLPRAARHRRPSLAALVVLLASGAVATTALLPGGSYLFLWPSLLTSAAACWPRRRWRRAALAIAAAGSTLELLPLAWLVTVAMTINLLAPGAAVLVLLTWLWLPPLAPLARRRYALAATAAVLSAVALAVTRAA